MDTLSRELWQDEAGFIISAELVIVGSLLVIGLITGLTCVQDAVVGEYGEVADAIGSLNQSYYYSGMQGCWSPRCGFSSWTAGSAYMSAGQNHEVVFGICPTCTVAPPVDAPPVVVPPVVCPPEFIPFEGPFIPPEAPCSDPVPVNPCETAVELGPRPVRPCPCELKDDGKAPCVDGSSAASQLPGTACPPQTPDTFVPQPLVW